MNNTLTNRNGNDLSRRFFDGQDLIKSNQNLFDLIFGSVPFSWGTKETGDTVRFHSEDDKISVEFDLPGVSKKDAEVTIGPARDGHYLQVKAKRSVLSSNGTREETVTKGTTLKNIDEDSLETKLENGILTVSAKKLNYKEKVGVRTLKIK